MGKKKEWVSKQFDKIMGRTETESSFSRDKKFRRSLTKNRAVITANLETNSVVLNSASMINAAKVKCAALIVLNDVYAGTDYDKLDGVKDDGEKMEKMLSTHGFQVEIKRNVEDIGKEVQIFFKNNEKAETFHFHFSGHGVENAIVQLAPKTSIKDKTGKKLDTSEPIGDCMVGSKGKLYSAHDLRHDLLGYHPGKAVATLDCCRDSNKRGASNLVVTLSHRREVSVANQKKIAVFQGTAELHTANDLNSFTKELYKVYEKEDKAIPILEIERMVNKSWDDQSITQICKLDIIRDGKSWIDYMWPAPRDARTKTEDVGESKKVTCMGAALNQDEKEPEPENTMGVSESNGQAESEIKTPISQVILNKDQCEVETENTSTDQNDVKCNEETDAPSIVTTLKELKEHALRSDQEIDEMKERMKKLEVKTEELQDEKKELEDEKQELKDENKKLRNENDFLSENDKAKRKEKMKINRKSRDMSSPNEDLTFDWANQILGENGRN